MSKKLPSFFATVKEKTASFFSKIRKKHVVLALKILLILLPMTLLSILYSVIDRKVAEFESSQIFVMELILAIVFVLTAVRICYVLSRQKWLEITRKILGGIFFAGFPYAVFVLTEWYIHDPFKADPVVMDSNIMTLNILVYYLLAILVLTLTTRTDIAIAVTAAVPMTLGIANVLSYAARSLPIYPWDVLSAGTAMTVVDNYSFEITARLAFTTFCFIGIICGGLLLGIRFKLPRWWMNLIAAIVAITVFLSFCGYLMSDEAEEKEGFYPYLFSANYLYKHNGTAVTFIYTLKYLQLTEPDGYSPDNLEDLYNEYHNQAADTTDPEAVLPNIIVIMNEGFCDPKILGDFETNIDYMPFIHSLSENTVKGNLLVSVKGGNTPNSEFEFLTGTSMAFLPSGSIPYQQHIKGDTLSLVSQLNSLGYFTVGMHPYGASGWQRDEVYPYLGFDETYFSRDFKNKKYVRSYISDETMFKQIMSLQESKDADTPMFVFGVTMQNHGDYPNKNNGSFQPEVEVVDNNYSYISYFNNYLSLLKVTDAAFEKLVNYYRNVDEPTIILMFGDHQPNDHVVSPILKANGITDISSESLEVQQSRYITPYILWSNYEIDGMDEMPEYTSLNYLGGLLMGLADVPLTPFQIWLEDLRAEYPLLNAFCYVDTKGEYHSIIGLQNLPGMNTYAQIQYNLIFDRKRLVNEFFSVVK